MTASHPAKHAQPSGHAMDDNLYFISSILSSSSDLRDTISRTFEILNESMDLQRATLTIKNPVENQIYIKMALGLTDDEIKKGVYQVGEGITGKVIETGEPAIIENIGTDPRFLNKTGSRSDLNHLAFICVPIKIGNEIIGALSVDRLNQGNKNLNEDFKVLNFIALLIAQTIKFQDLLEREKETLKNENTKLKEELKDRYNIHNMIGNSNAMQQVYENIVRVANSATTVLIRGESGTGKELVAHAIHYNSPRASKPFIKVNCSAIPETLLESELFGYEKGAFTDAYHQKIGKFEAANGGTIFLDEIGELSTNMQVKLLRVLQEKEFERIGGLTSVKVNVRIITATNKNLEVELENHRFREDLYYRLNVFPIFLPPLRERKSDIILLAEHFLKIYAKENEKSIHRISSLAIDLLVSYHWPGNVRELENCMERAILLCDSDTIKAMHLPPSLQRVDTGTESNESISLEELINNFERELIIDALKKMRGNKSKAAEYLKTTERIIGYKIEQLKIDYAKYKVRKIPSPIVG